jgi:hypothetical protein
MIRSMIRTGVLPAIVLNGRPRITPEAVREAEWGPLAVRPRWTKRREKIDGEIEEILR